MTAFFTKKQIAETCNLTLNTVRKTLECCGLDTAAQSYSQDDVQVFLAARDMLGRGMTYQQVAAHFGVGTSRPIQEEFSATGFQQNRVDEGLGAAAYAATDLVNATLDRLVVELEPLIAPMLTAKIFQSIGKQSAGLSHFAHDVRNGRVALPMGTQEDTIALLTSDRRTLLAAHDITEAI